MASSVDTAPCQIPARVPSALGYARHWVLRRGKKPCDQYGNAKGWQLSTFWISFQEACKVLERNGQGFSGAGFIIAREPGLAEKQIIGLDMDCCRDPQTGWISPWAQARLNLLSSYSEVTPSLTGFHVWIYGKLPEGVDSAFAEGQDPSELPPDTWERIKAVKPTANECNSLEIYEDGPRHFTVTGLTLEQYPGELMYRQDELEQLLEECVKPERKAEQHANDEIDAEWFCKMSEATRGQGLPALSILDVVNTSGWERSGDQLLGPHPILGSTTGRNVVINPAMNVYAYMHNGLKKGGDAWTWLGCECGAIRWEYAGAGSLKDPEALQKVKEYAVQRGYFSREQLFSINIPHVIRTDDKIIIDDAPLTEGGNATRLLKLFGDDIKYCHTYKKWLIWDDTRWQIDNDGKILRLAEKVVRHLYSLAANAENATARQALAAFAKSADRNFHLKNVLEIAKNREGIAITSKVLDCDEWKLCAPNCTIDLRTLEHHNPCREDLITKSINCNYVRDATCPTWLAFLEKIFQADQDLIRYLQRAVGYTLTGSTREQVYFFLHGSGANGKSVFLAVLRALLGDYAKQASFDTFLVQREAKVRNDLAALAGARLITASEAEEGSRLAMQVIKSWTGGTDPITARFLFGEDFTFKPIGKIWMAANTKPIISERNFAAWRRVHLVPFLITIPKPEQDTELESKLLPELSGVLNWALEGLREYHRIGLEPPEAVKAATEQYRRENDSLEAFVSEYCEFGKLAICRNSELFSAYLSYCGMGSFEPLSQKKFSEDMKGKPGITQTRDRSLGMLWHGIQLSLNWANPMKDDRDAAQDVKDVKANPQSFVRIASQGGDIEMPSHPSQKEAKNSLLISCEGLNIPLNGTLDLTPIAKAKIWDEVAWVLRHEPRRDGRKIGLTSSDVSEISKQPVKVIEESLKADGWDVSTVEISGLRIWWAPERALKAMGIS